MMVGLLFACFFFPAMCNNPCKHSGNTITVCFKKSRKEYAVGLVVKQIHRGKKNHHIFHTYFISLLLLFTAELIYQGLEMILVSVEVDPFTMLNIY